VSLVRSLEVPLKPLISFDFQGFFVLTIAL
jgi:hypothetical protein